MKRLIYKVDMDEEFVEDKDALADMIYRTVDISSENAKWNWNHEMRKSQLYQLAF
jgi:DNA-binding protein YbaB